MTAPAITTLPTRGFALDDLLMGPGTPYLVGPPTFGAAEIRDPASPRAREDGQRWGRGYRGSRTITLDIWVAARTEELAADAAEALAGAWNAAAVRAQAGGLSVLRWRWAGRDRRVYGRAGQCVQETRFDSQGKIPVTAEFTTQDHLYYSDDEFTASLGFIPEQQGGLILPLTLPLTLSGSGAASQGITVAGKEPAWLGWRVNGPISQPQVEVSGVWSATLDTSLASDSWAVVDPQPWARGVRRRDGANLAGRLSPGSPRLSLMRVPPGTHEVVLRGQDPTGTSSLDLFWRSCFASH